MPRVTDGRSPAEPSSPVQRERQRRILRAGARLGARHPFERVQMHDIAHDAGVAIGTLYRYFPSKTHLFAALLRNQVDHLAARTPDPAPGVPAADAVADLLVRGGERLLAAPLLAHAMLQSNNALVADPDAGALGALAPFHALLLRMARLEDPGPLELQLVRLVEQAWYGTLASVLNHHIDLGQAGEDTRLACARLLAGVGTGAGVVDGAGAA